MVRELQLQFISNPVTVRWLRVLAIIEREEQFTLGALSERLTVSQRTLATDVGYLKRYFSKSAVFTYNSNGYTFKETDRLAYQEQKKQLLEPEILFEIIGNIFYGEKETIGELAEYYNYSESTLRRFLTMAQKPLSEYGLEFSKNPITIIGDEAGIRKFFFDFYYEGAQTPHTLHPPQDLHDQLLELIKTLTDKQELGSGYTIKAFYYLLYITMERNRQGYTISLPDKIFKLDISENDFRLFYSIQPLIEKHYGIFLSEEEFSWIHLQLLSRRTIDRKEWEEVFFSHYNLWGTLEDLTERFLRENGFFQNNQSELPIFLSAFFLTRKLNDEISPVLNKMMVEERQSIQKNYPHILEKNQQFLLQNKKKSALSGNYLEDVAFSLTLYSQILFHYHAPAQSILFLLEGDSLIVQHIQTQAQQLLGYRHKIRYLKIDELTDQQLNTEEIDLLITNYSPYLSEYRLTKDYLLINQVPDRHDWNRILDKVNAPIINPL